MDFDALLGLAIIGTIWHVFAIWAFFLLAPFDKKWEGFYLTLLFGPVGFVAVLFIHGNLVEKRKRGLIP